MTAPTADQPLIERRPFPLGKLRKPYAVTCSAAERPRLVTLNRYPGQIIGFTLRLPWAGVTRRPGAKRVTDICQHRHGSAEAARECAQ